MPLNLYDQQRRNIANTRMFIAGFVLLLVLIGLGADGDAVCGRLLARAADRDARRPLRRRLLGLVVAPGRRPRRARVDARRAPRSRRSDAADARERRRGDGDRERPAEARDLRHPGRGPQRLRDRHRAGTGLDRGDAGAAREARPRRAAGRRVPRAVARPELRRAPDDRRRGARRGDPASLGLEPARPPLGRPPRTLSRRRAAGSASSSSRSGSCRSSSRRSSPRSSRWPCRASASTWPTPRAPS